MFNIFQKNNKNLNEDYAVKDKNHLYNLLRLGVLRSTYIRYRTSQLAIQKEIIDSSGELVAFKSFDDIDLQLSQLDLDFKERKYYKAHSDFEDDFDEDRLGRYQYEDFYFVMDKKDILVSIEHNEYYWQIMFKNILLPYSKELSKELYNLADLSTNKLGLNLLIRTGVHNSKMCVDLVFQAIKVDGSINIDDLVDFLFYQWNTSMNELCSIIEMTVKNSRGSYEN